MDFLTSNTSLHCTDSYSVYVLKIEYVSKTTIFGLKIMVKSDLEKTLSTYRKRPLRTEKSSIFNFERIKVAAYFCEFVKPSTCDEHL